MIDIVKIRSFRVFEVNFVQHLLSQRGRKESRETNVSLKWNVTQKQLYQKTLKRKLKIQLIHSIININCGQITKKKKLFIGSVNQKILVTKKGICHDGVKLLSAKL